MEERQNTPRYELHRLIGLREKAEKRNSTGFNSQAQEEYLKCKKEIEELLKKHPELESAVETVEEHFFKKLYT